MTRERRSRVGHATGARRHVTHRSMPPPRRDAASSHLATGAAGEPLAHPDGCACADAPAGLA